MSAERGREPSSRIKSVSVNRPYILLILLFVAFFVVCAGYILSYPALNSTPREPSSSEANFAQSQEQSSFVDMTPSQIISRIQSVIPEMIRDSNLDSEARKDINEDLSYAGRLAGEADREGGVSRNLKAFRGAWFLERAFLKETYYEAKTCVENFTVALSTYKNDLCFVPDFKSVSTFKVTNSSLESSGRYFVGRDAQSIDDIDEIIDEINQIHTTRLNLLTDSIECNQALDFQKKSFGYQSGFCQNRQISISLFQLSSLVLILCIGFLVGILLESKFNMVKRLTKFINEAELRVGSWWRKQSDISKTTLITAIVSYLGFFGVLFLFPEKFSDYVVGLILVVITVVGTSPYWSFMLRKEAKK